MRRPRSLALFAVTLVAAQLLTISDAAASELPVIAAGRLLDSAGRPAAGDVQLFAWPSRHGLEVGDTVQLIPVGRTRVGPSGEFTLRSGASPQLAALAADNGGYVNLEARALTGRFVQETHLSRYVAGASTGAYSSAGGQNRDFAWRAGPDEAATPVTVHLDPAASTQTMGNDTRPMQGGCSGMKVVDSQIGETVIGELRTPPDTDAARFTYGKRADSEISVAARGADGPWSISGSHHIANAQGAAVNQDARGPEHLQVSSRFVYDKFEYLCPSGRREKVVPREWLGDVTSQNVSERGCRNASDSRLGRFGPGTGFRRDKERAVTWSGAADIFGVSLSARSGYSEQVQAVWDFGDAPLHLLCGDDGPPLKSRRIFAGFSA
jgi:hypothetical protein